MKTPALAALTLLTLSCGPAPAPAPRGAPAPPAGASLYQRLGGYDALAAVTDEFLRRMLGDPPLAAYFDNLDGEGRPRVRQMIVDQLCALTGGPCVYVGADMPTAHKDLNITDADWDRAVGHLGATLDQFRVPPGERRELLEIIATTRNEIVGK